MNNRTTAPSQSARTGHAKRSACVMGSIALAVLAQLASAGLIASNAGVPTIMDAGGTAEDPAVYRYDAYAPVPSNTAMRVGTTTSYNRLEILNGSKINVYNTSYGMDTKNVGYGSATGHNSLWVSGAGTVFTVSGQGYFNVGYQSSYNAMTVDAGASNNIPLNLQVGGNALSGAATSGGSFNTVVVDGASMVCGRTYAGMYSGSSSNSIRIVNGSWVKADRLYIGVDSATYPGAHANSVTVTGPGTILAVAGAFNVGTGTSTSNNTLTVANGALARSDGQFSVITVGTANGGNAVRLAGGFVAQLGNKTTSLANSQVLVWDGSAWVPGVKGTNWTATYYSTEAAALAATGYSGLYNATIPLGYTIYTGGTAITPPASPTTVLLVR